MQHDLVYYKNLILEAETTREKLILEELPVKSTELSPIMSKNTIDYHYDTLARSYVDRYNKKEGDDDFNLAGAYLHNIFFPQLMSPSKSNKPQGNIKLLIEKHFETFENLKNEIESVAMSIQGSGWVYLDKFGEIKTIKNHQIKSNIVLLIDWWEHAWALDYQADKKKYLKNLWQIINWSVINNRLVK